MSSVEAHGHTGSPPPPRASVAEAAHRSAHTAKSKHVGTPPPIGVPTANWLIGTLIVCTNIFVGKLAYRKGAFLVCIPKVGQVFSSAPKWAHREPRPIHTPNTPTDRNREDPPDSPGGMGGGENTPTARAH